MFEITALAIALVLFIWWMKVTGDRIQKHTRKMKAKGEAMDLDIERKRMDLDIARAKNREAWSNVGCKWKEGSRRRR